jgi:nitrile hydratase accessory protein
MSEASDGPLFDSEGPAAPPRSNGELVFAAPWESRLFGVSVALHERGLLDWNRFRERLVAEIRARESEQSEDSVRGDSVETVYYERWQSALERLLADDGLCIDEEIEQRTRQLAARPKGHDHETDAGV